MDFIRNLQYAIRVMARRPLFTIAIVLTLGVAIGAVTAVFSVVDATLLRPLPYPNPHNLAQVVLHQEYQGQSYLQTDQDGAAWEILHRSVQSVDLAVYSDGLTGLSLSSGSDVDYVHQQRVSAGFFRVLGIASALGREFTSEEDLPNGPPVVLLSYPLWQRVFHGDPSIVGRTTLIGGQNHEVVGIAAPGFHSNVDADLWTPLRPTRTGEGDGSNYTIIGRLRQGVTWAQADGEIQSAGQAVVQGYRHRPGTQLRFGIQDLQRSITDSYAEPLLLILAAAVLVLVIGCVNIAGMLLARGAARASEMATRMALGASRSDILRQLLIESLVLAIAGGSLGILIGHLGLIELKSMLPAGFSALKAATLDGRVLLVIALASISTSLFFGLFPAWQAGRIDIRSAQTGRGIVSSGAFSRHVFSTVQIALAAALLIGAGLLLRSFNYLWELNPGFDPANVTTASFSLRDARYGTSEQINRFFQDGVARLQAIPGVQSAAVTLNLPYERGLNLTFRKASESEDVQHVTNLTYATPGFFDALRIPILRGRGIADMDTAASTPVIVVNEAFVRRYYQGTDPTGMLLRFGSETREIAGVVGDIQQAAGWGSYGPMGAVPATYIPATQVDAATFRLVHTWSSPNWVIRSSTDSALLQREVRDAIKSIDPMLPIAEFRSLQEIKSNALGWQRLMATLLGVAAGLALLLSAIGTYAMISNAVVERTREFGIRLALGATFSQTILDSMKPGLICAAIGLTVGLIAGLAATQLLQGMIWGIRPTDPTTFVAVAIGMLAVASVASLIPALRITQLDPSQTLRQE